MALLITPAEVLQTAFPATEQFRDDLIRPTMIEVAQLQYLQPVFGALFDALEEERYSDFVSTYIKPPLAYYIRCMVIDELTASVGTLGILQEKSDYGSPASIRLQERLRRQDNCRAFIGSCCRSHRSQPRIVPRIRPGTEPAPLFASQGRFYSLKYLITPDTLHSSNNKADDS